MTGTIQLDDHLKPSENVGKSNGFVRHIDLDHDVCGDGCLGRRDFFCVNNNNRKMPSRLPFDVHSFQETFIEVGRVVGSRRVYKGDASYRASVTKYYDVVKYTLALLMSN